MGTTNNNSTPSTATTTTSLERSHFEALFPTTTTSTTTQSKWAAAATPTAPARAALRSGLLHLRQISPSSHQPTFGNIIRQHHNVTALLRAFTIVFLNTGKHVKGPFFGT